MDANNFEETKISSKEISDDKFLKNGGKMIVNEFSEDLKIAFSMEGTISDKSWAVIKSLTKEPKISIE